MLLNTDLIIPYIIRVIVRSTQIRTRILDASKHSNFGFGCELYLTQITILYCSLFSLVLEMVDFPNDETDFFVNEENEKKVIDQK